MVDEMDNKISPRTWLRPGPRGLWRDAVGDGASRKIFGLGVG